MFKSNALRGHAVIFNSKLDTCGYSRLKSDCEMCTYIGVTDMRILVRTCCSTYCATDRQEPCWTRQGFTLGLFDNRFHELKVARPICEGFAVDRQDRCLHSLLRFVVVRSSSSGAPDIVENALRNVMESLALP